LNNEIYKPSSNHEDTIIEKLKWSIQNEFKFTKTSQSTTNILEYKISESNYSFIELTIKNCYNLVIYLLIKDILISHADNGDNHSSLVNKIDSFLKMFSKNTKKYHNILLAIYLKFNQLLSIILII
jgi:hypothetical protein